MDKKSQPPTADAGRKPKRTRKSTQVDPQQRDTLSEAELEQVAAGGTKIGTTSSGDGN
jgi:hypothetical protein